MYVQNAADLFGIGRIDPTKYPKMLLRDGEEHFKTYVFDALPFVPRDGATREQVDRRIGKKLYLEAIQYHDRIAVECGYVRAKIVKCPKCQTSFATHVQKAVDVRMSVRLTALAWERIVGKMVLVCGDADLIPAVRATEPTGTIVRLAYFSEGVVRTSQALIRACPEKQQLKRSDLAYCKLEPR